MALNVSVPEGYASMAGIEFVLIGKNTDIYRSRMN
jgi:hypothetical protein